MGCFLYCITTQQLAGDLVNFGEVEDGADWAEESATGEDNAIANLNYRDHDNSGGVDVGDWVVSTPVPAPAPGGSQTPNGPTLFPIGRPHLED